MLAVSIRLLALFSIISIYCTTAPAMVTGLLEHYRGLKFNSNEFQNRMHGGGKTGQAANAIIGADPSLGAAANDLPVDRKEIPAQLKIFEEKFALLKTEYSEVLSSSQAPYRQKKPRTIAEIHNDLVFLVKVMLLQRLLAEPDEGVIRKTKMTTVVAGVVALNVAVNLALYTSHGLSSGVIATLSLIVTAISANDMIYSQHSIFRLLVDQRQKKKIELEILRTLGIPPGKNSMELISEIFADQTRSDAFCASLLMPKETEIRKRVEVPTEETPPEKDQREPDYLDDHHQEEAPRAKASTRA